MALARGRHVCDGHHFSPVESVVTRLLGEQQTPLQFYDNVVDGLTLAVFSVPVLWGLITLAGKSKANWSSTVNNIVGPLIIIVGLVIPVTIGFYLEKLVARVAGRGLAPRGVGG